MRPAIFIFGILGPSALVFAAVSSGGDSHQRCGFDFPVGPPDAAGFYDAQPFGANHHLGNDWNGIYGGDSDLGTPIHAIAAGTVVDATDYDGDWGNVLRIRHGCADGVESLYAHLDQILVAPGAPVVRGQLIGTMGNAHGRYRAHLHFEMRERSLPVGQGYSEDPSGYLDATAYIRAHRPPPSP